MVANGKGENFSFLMTAGHQSPHSISMHRPWSHRFSVLNSSHNIHLLDITFQQLVACESQRLTREPLLTIKSKALILMHAHDDTRFLWSRLTKHPSDFNLLNVRSNWRKATFSDQKKKRKTEKEKCTARKHDWRVICRCCHHHRG